MGGRRCTHDVVFEEDAEEGQGDHVHLEVVDPQQEAHEGHAALQGVLPSEHPTEKDFHQHWATALGGKVSLCTINPLVHSVH